MKADEYIECDFHVLIQVVIVGNGNIRTWRSGPWSLIVVRCKPRLQNSLGLYTDRFVYPVVLLALMWNLAAPAGFPQYGDRFGQPSYSLHRSIDGQNIKMQKSGGLLVYPVLL